VFLREGAKVVVADVKAPTEAMDALFVEVDVSTKESAEHLVSTTVKRYGSIDVLVNNAGITDAADFSVSPRKILTVCCDSTSKACFSADKPWRAKWFERRRRVASSTCPR